MPSNLQEESRQWHQQAGALLQASGLVSLLSRYGEVNFTGSYHYDLMLGPDIDIHVVATNASKDQAQRLLNTLIDQSWWNAFRFADWKDEKFRTEQWKWLPSAYYLNVKNDWQDSRWKVDIWLMDKHGFKDNNRDKIVKKLTKRQRLVVLQLKQARNNNVINGNGYDFIRAVLAGVGSVKEFIIWQSNAS